MRIKGLSTFGHLLFCVVATFGIVSVVSPFIPQSTDIIGYPLWANYNINQLFFKAYAWMLLPPLIFLCKRYGLPFGRSLAQNLKSQHPNYTRFELPITGLCFGFHAYGLNVAPTSFVMAFIGIVVAYCTLVTIAARLFKKTISSVNSWGIVLLPLTLVSVSSSTGMSFVDSHRYTPWCPLWLGGLGVLALVAVHKILSLKSPKTLAQPFFNFVACPFLIFLVHSSLPQHLPSIHWDFHHPGEILVPAHWIRAGMFPWRDVMLHQGLLADPIKAWAGMTVLEPSWWGAEAGERLFLIPLALVFSYLLRRRMFSNQAGFILFVTFLLPLAIPGLFGRRVAYYERLMLYPIYLLLLTVAFGRKKWFPFFVSGLLMGLLIFLTPETALLALAVLLAMGARGFLTRRFEIFPWLGGLVIATVISVAWLSYYGALSAYIDYFRYFLGGYRFIYGMPLNGKGISGFWMLITIPGVLFFLTAVRLERAWRSKEDLTPIEWMLVVVSFFAVLYFQKFLNEADDHIYPIIFCTLPFLEYLLSKLWFFLSSHRYLWAPAALIAFGVMGLRGMGPGIPWDRAPTKYTTDGRTGYGLNGAGLVLATDREKVIIKDFHTLFDAVLTPTDPISDLTNSSHLFHYLLARPFVERFPQTITLVSPNGQQDLIDAIARVRPKIIVFDRRFGFDVSLPIPINVRFYKVSAAVLDKYVPWINLNGYALVRRRDWAPGELDLKKFMGSASFENIPLNACDWRAVAHNWSGREPPGEDYVEISFDKVVKDHWTITGGVTAEPIAQNRITFDSLDAGALTYRIPVGSCLQWSTWEGKPIYLHHTKPQAIREVRVVVKNGQPTKTIILAKK